MTERGKALQDIRQKSLLVKQLERTASLPGTGKFIREMVDRELAELKPKIKKACELFAMERPALQQFCVLYYLECRSMTEIPELINRHPRQVSRYKAEIERGIICRKNKEEKQHDEHQEDDH